MSGFNFIACTICNKPFQSFSGKICGACLQQIDKDFVVARDYIYDHPVNVSIDELEEETGISRKIILHLLKEGRLSFKDGSGSVILCESCKKPIASGRMCDECRNSLSQKLASTIPQPPKPAVSDSDFKKRSVGMHLDHSKK